jgi:hypothetical protein
MVPSLSTDEEFGIRDWACYHVTIISWLLCSSSFQGASFDGAIDNTSLLTMLA